MLLSGSVLEDGGLILLGELGSAVGSVPLCTRVFSHTRLLCLCFSLCVSLSFSTPYSYRFFLQSLLGDGPLRLLLLPSIHLEALDLLSALILA